ncbi:methyltransferase [candidate division KSB1 bacterium]|nr:methyltransferase [candidate division KSB1 bacterium]RQW00118.1 MAG: methyltransferase [candidate division KSB1 bacterium]
MTPRDRILTALNHQQPDCVPIDLGGHRSSGIMAIAYNKLKKYLGITSGDIYVYDMVQQLALIEEPIPDLFGIDTIEMGRGFLLNESDWKEWLLPDGTPSKIPSYISLKKRGDDWLLLNDRGLELGVQKKGCLYFEQIYYPLAERGIADDDFCDLEERLGENIWSIPHPGAHLDINDENQLQQMVAGAKKLRMATDRAIIGLFGGNMFETPQMMYRTDNWLLYHLMYPQQAHAFLEKLAHIHLKNLEKWLSAVGRYIDIILFGDDLGSQSGPLVSVDMYREFYKPYHKMLWNRAKQLADVKVLLHSCGAIEPFIDDFIDAGLDAVNPVQISCSGMDARSLKKKYAGRITLWGGGCDTQSILPDASPDVVKKHVKKQMNILAPGGDFVFQQVHNIMANVPPENIVAMLEAVEQY